MQEKQELLNSILEKASQNEEFRQRLLVDAKTAISSDFKIALPDGLNIVVHENDANTVHLPVPPSPKVLDEGKLAQVSGGQGNDWGQCV